MATINTAFSSLFINGVSHTKKVSTDAGALEGLDVVLHTATKMEDA